MRNAAFRTTLSLVMLLTAGRGRVTAAQQSGAGASDPLETRVTISYQNVQATEVLGALASAGGFTLEMDDIDRLTREVVSRAEQWCGGRLVSALEGGYDPERLGEAAVRHMRALRVT